MKSIVTCLSIFWEVRLLCAPVSASCFQKVKINLFQRRLKTVSRDVMTIYALHVTQNIKINVLKMVIINNVAGKVFNGREYNS